jgi:hypothetical protein
MRKAAAALLLLFCFSPYVYGQKTRYGQILPKAKPGVDYPLNVHIYATHLRTYCPQNEIQVQPEPKHSCIDVIYADVNIGGKKIELMTDTDVNLDPFRPLTLPLGIYQARFTKNAPNMDSATIGLKYDLLLPDNRVLRCTVTGVSE